jgi:hypothetical protein
MATQQCVGSRSTEFNLTFNKHTIEGIEAPPTAVATLLPIRVGRHLQSVCAEAGSQPGCAVAHAVPNPVAQALAAATCGRRWSANQPLVGQPLKPPTARLPHHARGRTREAKADRGLALALSSALFRSLWHCIRGPARSSYCS